jgi:hypothetical protein
LRRQLAGTLLLGALSILASLSLAEGVVRGIANRDADGNFLVRGRPLRPYHPPVEHTRTLVERYLADPSPVLAYDPDLGWAPRPGTSSKDGLYRYDAVGARSGRTARPPRGGEARVLLFGDSFTHGDDVSHEESWASQLQDALDAGGAGARVVNLGFAGYGMDQALLRWRKSGAALAPAAVVFGFQAENVARNLNILRPLLWWGSGLPFSKPRFVLEGGELRLLNSPAIPPDRVPDVLASLADWPLSRYEGSYRPADYQPRWWLRSRLASLTWEGVRSLKNEPPSHYAATGEPARLAAAIVAAFEREVRGQGAGFFVVHLPKREDLARAAGDAALDYRDLLAEIQRHHRVVDPTPRLLERAEGGRLGELFVSPENGHYSGSGHAAVAGAVAEALIGGGVISVTSPLR